MRGCVIQTRPVAWAVMAVALAAAFLPSGVRAEASSRPFTTGVTTTDIVPAERLAFKRVKQAGATYIRILVYWNRVAPIKKPAAWNPADPADPNYRWINDNDVRMAVEAGLEPIVMVYGAPTWAERCKDPVPGICNPEPPAFAKFAEAVARRYGGGFKDLPKVRFWEPWNEPNLFLFFKPQFSGERKTSPALYRRLLNTFSNTVKRIDPANKVIAGGLAPLERPGGIGPMDFMRRLLCMQGRAKPVARPGCPNRARFDIWATNPYTTGGPAREASGPDDTSLGDLPEMRRLLDAAGRNGKIVGGARKVPFWITEFSWDSAPPDPGGVPMRILARWVPEAMFRAWQAGVSMFSWLTLRDWPRHDGLPFSETIESGLYFRGRTVAGDRPKRILRAFRFPFVAFPWKRAISIWGRTPGSNPGTVRLAINSGSGWRSIGTVKADRSGVFRTVVKRNRPQARRGRVRARYGSNFSLSFPLTPTPDFRHPPFGRPD